MRIRTQTAARVEVAGLLLVLLALGWQMFLEEPVAGLYSGAKEFEVNERLEIVFRYMQGLRTEVVERQPPPPGLEYNHLKDTWNRLDSRNSGVAKQASFMRYVRVILFLIGSVLLSVGRYSELQRRLLEHTPTNPTSGSANSLGGT
jgi:hypothetical protein